MKQSGEFCPISLEAWWWRALLGAIALLSAWALASAGARHAFAHRLAGASDPSELRRALARDPDHAELHRQLGRQSLLSLDLPRAEASYQAALHHHRFDPEIWLEYSFVCETGGEVERARTAVLRAVELAPASARVLLAAGNFFARRNDWDATLTHFRRAIASDVRAAGAVLETCWNWAPDRSQILTRALPRRTEAYEAYLQFLVDRLQWDEAKHLWEWARQQGRLPGVPAGVAYVNALLAARRPAQARAVWESLVPSTAAGNLIHNARFTRPLMNAGFDWLYAPAPGVELAYQRDREGTALALRFGGRDNPDYWHLRQNVAVRDGAGYRLEVFLKAEGITSTSGPRLEVRDAYSDRVLACSDPVAGSTDWQKKALEFLIPKETELITVGVRRPAAPAWDELIAGTLWLRDFNLRPVPQASRPFSTTGERAQP